MGQASDPMSDWDNIRYFLAVAREGTLSGAARSLKVNHSTVLRRLTALQQDMSVQLFSREGNDRTLSQAGLDMLPYAEQIEAAVMELSQRVSGMDTRLSGTVRLTTTDSLAATVVPSLIAAFRLEFPQIHINLIVDNMILNLARDADVSLRPARSIDDSLIGRSVCRLAAAVFTSQRYLEQHGVPRSAEELWNSNWIVPDPSLDRYAVTKWLQARVPPERIVATSTSILTVAASVRHGLGYAVLPCFLGDTQQEIVRVSEPIEDVMSTLWLVTHTDLRKHARVRAFRDFAVKYLSAHVDTIEGRAPTALACTPLTDSSYFTLRMAG